MARAGDGLGVVVDSASLQQGGGQIWLLGPVKALAASAA